MIKYLEEALTYIMKKNYEQAEKSLKKYSEAESDNDKPMLLSFIGNLCSRQKRYDLAEQLYKEGLKIEPKNLELLKSLGDVYSNQEKYDLAEVEYKKGLEIEPKNPELLLSLGKLYFHQERYDLAEQIYKKGLEIEPENPILLLLIGKLYFHQERYDLAEQTFRKGLEIEPENLELLILLGSIYSLQDKFELAEQTFKQGLEIEPDNFFIIGALGELYYNQKKYTFAEQTLKKGLDIQLDYDIANQIQKIGYENVDNIEILKKIFSIDFFNIMRDFIFSICNVNKSRLYEESIDKISKSGNEEDIIHNLQLGLLHSDADHVEEALYYLEKVKQLFDKDHKLNDIEKRCLYEHLFLNYLKKEDQAKSEEMLELLLTTRSRQEDNSLTTKKTDMPMLMLDSLKFERLEGENKTYGEKAILRFIEEERKKKNEELQKCQFYFSSTYGLQHEHGNILSIIARNIYNAKVDLEHPDLINEVKDSLDTALEQIQRLQDSIDKLKNMTKKEFYQFDSIPIKDFIESYIKRYRTRIDELNINIENQLEPNLMISAVKDLLGIVIDNLISNAVDMFKAADINRKNLLIFRSEEDKKDKDEVYICVEDNGTGMDETILKQLFKYPITNKGHGGGGGLYTSYQNLKGMMQDSKPRLFVESERGRGTIFKIKLKKS